MHLRSCGDSAWQCSKYPYVGRRVGRHEFWCSLSQSKDETIIWNKGSTNIRDGSQAEDGTTFELR